MRSWGLLIERFGRSSFLFVALFTVSLSVQGQAPERLIRRGNRAYERGEYGLADSLYSRALEVDEGSLKAKFNRGTALEAEGEYAAAVQEYGHVAVRPDASEALRGDAYYNAGNALFHAKDLAKSIESYKAALRLNPNDMDAKYNLSEALRLMAQSEGGGGNQNQEQEQEGDQDQQDQQGDQDQEGSQGEDQQQAQGEQGQQGEQGEEEKEGEGAQGTMMSEAEAERLLQALENQQQEVNEKMQRARKKGKGPKRDKDW